MLTTADLQNLQEGASNAVGIEKKNLDELRKLVQELHVIELGYRQCYAVAPVATDGGESGLSLEPINIEIIRVADSDGIVHFEGILPLTLDPEELGSKLFQEVPILKSFCVHLGRPWEDISYLLFSIKEQEDPNAALAIADARRFVKTLRDLLEWATLLDLAFSSGRPTFLLIRDGLLRTKFIKKSAFPGLVDAFRNAYAQQGALIVGVAKRSKALNYLSLALALEGTFNRQSPCFVEVPEEIEKKAYTWAATWMEGQRLPGRLHLVKLTEGRDSIILPVDIPEWLLPRRKEVLEYLAETAKASFPIPGYPYPLIKAHENANISGLEASVIEDLIIRALLESADEKDKEKLVRHITLGRGIIKGGGQGG